MDQPYETLTLAQKALIRGYTGLSTGKNKYNATTAPTATDDSSAGYLVGSVWFDITAKIAYSCVSAAVGLAVWQGAGAGGAEESMGVVIHGSNAGTARPAGYPVVTWIGSVEPLNAINSDIWEVTV